MKNILSLLIICLTFSFSLQAQDAKRDLRKASRSLGSYTLDPTANKSELEEAKQLIESVLKDPEYQKDAKAWTVKGQIYNEIALNDFKMLAINPEHIPTSDDAGLIAYNAFKKGLECAEKKYEEKDALSGLSEASTYLNSLGLVQYQNGNYKLSYEYFHAVLDIHNIMEDNGMNSPLATNDDYLNQLYITGLSALNGELLGEAGEFFTKLKDLGYEKAVVYEGLFTIYAKSDPDMAGEILQEGREKFPDDSGLLFAQINYLLQRGEMDQLIERLELAIEKEPTNATIYSTLGSVYENLFQRTSTGSDSARTYFDLAMKNYEKTLELNPEDFMANYSIGALYYNKAAKVVEDMNALASDLSKEGMKKYDMKKEQMEKLFDQALPYFEQAENLNPDDRNTLIALKEIYARKGEVEKSNAYKQRIEDQTEQ
jgi:hypothetical protein